MNTLLTDSKEQSPVEHVRIVPEAPTRARYVLLGFLCALYLILYLDRVCISQAAVPMQQELGLTTTQLGFVFSAFTLAYGLFEIPMGHWGDRRGARGVLTRIVIWWSAFTALTGAATGLTMLLVTRFLFGAGEAGALPNSARIVSRWFPRRQRATAQSFLTTCAILGGGLAPILTAYLIQSMGWRWSFVAFGTLGVFWAVPFYLWFRDDPAKHPSVNAAELSFMRDGNAPEAHSSIPWKRVLTNRNVWLMGGIMTCAASLAYMFIAWYPTYLQTARGVSAVQAGRMTSTIMFAGAAGCFLGGMCSDWLFRRQGGQRQGSRHLGTCAFCVATLSFYLSLQCDSPSMANTFMAFACFCAYGQSGVWWTVASELSGPHVGALTGMMNSMGIPIVAASQSLLGILVDWLGGRGYVVRDSWDNALLMYTAVLVTGAVCWQFIDFKRPLAEVPNSDGPLPTPIRSK